ATLGAHRGGPRKVGWVAAKEAPAAGFDTPADRQDTIRRFKTSRMGPGCDPTVFFASLQQSLDRALPGPDGVSLQQLLSDQFVEGMQPALGAHLRLAGVTGQVCVEELVYLAGELAEDPLATLQSQEKTNDSLVECGLKLSNWPNSLQHSRRNLGGTLERADAISVACVTTRRIIVVALDPCFPGTESVRHESVLRAASARHMTPTSSVYLAAFNVRTLKQAGQQAALALTLDLLGIDVCCVSETRTQDTSTVIELIAPSVSTRFRLRTSGDPEAAAVGCAGVGIVLSHRAEISSLDQISVDIRLCAVRLATSVKESHKWQVDRCPFIVSAYAPTDCSSDAVKDRFYDALNALPRTSGIVVVAGDLNAQGLLVGFTDPIIHSFNKTAASIANGDYARLSSQRPCVLLLGDSTGDVHMADGATVDDPTGISGTVLRIGFLNEAVEANLEKYKTLYDIVLVNDDTFAVPLAVMKSILQCHQAVADGIAAPTTNNTDDIEL
ncbi:hypothetical protein T265_14019, partial [Opisthorchis viverrini]